MSLRQKAARGIAWSAVQNFGTQATSLIVFIVLARLLQPEDFGLVAIAIALIAFMQVFFGQGFGSAIVQRHELEAGHLDTAFWTNLCIGLLAMAFVIAAAGLLADLFDQSQLKPIIQWLSLSFLFGALSNVQMAILRRNLAFRTIAMRSLMAEPVGGVAGVVMALQGFGVWSLVARQLVRALVMLLVLWRISDWRPGIKVSTRHFRELFIFGVHITGTNIIKFISQRGYNIIIGYFLGPITLGYYTIAHRFVSMMSDSLSAIVERVVWPIFSRLQREPQRIRNALYIATQLTALVAFPAFLGIIALSPEIVLIALSKKWVPSIPLMQALACIGLIHSLIYYFSEAVMFSLGKVSWRLGVHAAIAVTNVIGFLVAVHWGIVAVAISYVIVGYLFAPVFLWMVHRLIQINFQTYLGQYLAPVVGSVVMLVFIFALKLIFRDSISLVLQTIIYVLSGASAYVLTVHLVFPSLLSQVIGLLRSIRKTTVP